MSAFSSSQFDDLANFIRLYQEGITGFNRTMEMLEIAPDIQEADAAVDLTHVRGQVEFRNVSFKYRQNHDYVIRNISLTFSPASTWHWSGHPAWARRRFAR